MIRGSEVASSLTCLLWSGERLGCARESAEVSGRLSPMARRSSGPYEQQHRRHRPDQRHQRKNPDRSRPPIPQQSITPPRPTIHHSHPPSTLRRSVSEPPSPSPREASSTADPSTHQTLNHQKNHSPPTQTTRRAVHTRLSGGCRRGTDLNRWCSDHPVRPHRRRDGHTTQLGIARHRDGRTGRRRTTGCLPYRFEWLSSRRSPGCRTGGVHALQLGRDSRDRPQSRSQHQRQRRKRHRGLSRDRPQVRSRGPHAPSGSRHQAERSTACSC
jgi:hypothetical protein